MIDVVLIVLVSAFLVCLFIVFVYDLYLFAVCGLGFAVCMITCLLFALLGGLWLIGFVFVLAALRLFCLVVLFIGCIVDLRVLDTYCWLVLFYVWFC